MRVAIALLMLPVLSAAWPALADEPVIGQKDKMFSQDIVTIRPGETVQFLNDDDIQHNLTVKEPDGVSRPGVVQPPGGDTHIMFDKLGDNMVRCLIHPKMKMTVHVE